MSPYRTAARAIVVITMLLTYSCFAQEERWERRDQWQNFPRIFSAMDVQEGSVVADVGCREGYLTVRLAGAVGERGTVYGVDIDAEALERLRKNLQETEISNVVAVHSRPDDPMLPDSVLDAIVVVNSYHEFDAYREMLAHFLTALKPGGRLVIVEPAKASSRGDSREAQVAEHRIALHFVLQEVREAGFEIVEALDPFVERAHRGDEMWLLAARKPSEP